MYDSTTEVGNCNWQVLRADRPASGECEGCGLPHWAQASAYRIPGVKGWFSSILCAEAVQFGSGRCRWCGEKLAGPAHQRFCDETCATNSARVPFGNGMRLLNWLAKHQPEAYCAMTHGEENGKCRCCGGVLPGSKRSDSQFCDDRCRMRFKRKSGTMATTQSPRNSANSDLVFSATYKSQKSGWMNTP